MVERRGERRTSPSILQHLNSGSMATEPLQSAHISLDLSLCLLSFILLFPPGAPPPYPSTSTSTSPTSLLSKQTGPKRSSSSGLRANAGVNIPTPFNLGRLLLDMIESCPLTCVCYTVVLCVFHRQQTSAQPSIINVHLR